MPARRILVPSIWTSSCRSRFRSRLLVLLLGASVVAQSGSAWVMAPDAPENAALRGLHWRSIGPANPGGRISVVAGVPGKPEVFYVAGAAGGIAKTVNGGVTFTQLFDAQDVASIGDIQVAPSNENVLWVGTGEGDPRNSTSFGDGVYRSTTGGQSWTHVGLEDTERIKRIAVDPQNPDTSPSSARSATPGARTKSAACSRPPTEARTGRRCSTRTSTTGCSDLAMDPTNANALYAGMYTFRRKPYRFDSGGGETALYKTTDAGETWTKLTNGLPKGAMDRPGIADCRRATRTSCAISSPRRRTKARSSGPTIAGSPGPK